MACINVTSQAAMQRSCSHLLPMSSGASSCVCEGGVPDSWMSNGRPADTKQPTRGSVSVEQLMTSNADDERPAACMQMGGAAREWWVNDRRWAAMDWWMNDSWLAISSSLGWQQRWTEAVGFSANFAAMSHSVFMEGSTEALRRAGYRGSMATFFWSCGTWASRKLDHVVFCIRGKINQRAWPMHVGLQPCMSSLGDMGWLLRGLCPLIPAN